MRLSLVAAALLIACTGVGCGGGQEQTSDPGPLVRWGEPAGEPTGVVMLLHGGGWQPDRPAFRGELPFAADLRRQGYATVVVDYGAGPTGYIEIQRVYEEARRRFPGLPVCIHGTSAGGNLALMLAAREPGVACVVDLGGPTDLSALKAQGGTEAYDLAVNAFGEDQLANWSPIRLADQIRARLLLLFAVTDSVVPVAQGTEFARTQPGTELQVLPGGSFPLVALHGAGVTPEAAESANTRTFTFLAQSMSGG